MKKMKNWYRNRTIQEQIRIALILVSISSAVILGIASYGLSKHTIEKNYKEVFTYNLKSDCRYTNE